MLTAVESNPPAGFREFDRGTLTLLAPDELVYESRLGQTVTLRPTDEPQLSGPCA